LIRHAGAFCSIARESAADRSGELGNGARDAVYSAVRLGTQRNDGDQKRCDEDAKQHRDALINCERNRENGIRARGFAPAVVMPLLLRLRLRLWLWLRVNVYRGLWRWRLRLLLRWLLQWLLHRLRLRLRWLRRRCSVCGRGRSVCARVHRLELPAQLALAAADASWVVRVHLVVSPITV
jgi:hypothetical protein